MGGVRTKESLEKLYAQRKKVHDKKRAKEAEYKKKYKYIEDYDFLLEQYQEDRNWAKRFLKQINENPEAIDNCDYIKLSIHSAEILSILGSKKNLTPNERYVFSMAFEFAYPNEH